jgi:ParB-like chromosome segregation protein Spo0J
VGREGSLIDNTRWADGIPSSQEPVRSFKKARQKRDKDIRALRNGSDDEKRLAEQLKSCSKRNPCRLRECAVCERRKWRAIRSATRSLSSRSVAERTSSIHIGAIEVNAKNHRPLEPARIPILEQTIQLIGLQHPLVVRKKGDKFELVSGQHCLVACRNLGWKTVPCKIFIGNRWEARVASIIENVARIDLRVLDRSEQVNEIRQLLRAKWEEGQDAPPGGKQPQDQAVKKTAIKLGLSKEEVRRCKRIAMLSPLAKGEARAQELDDDQHALLRVAEAETPAAQLAILAEIVKAKELAKIRYSSDAQKRAAIKRDELADEITKQEASINRQKAELSKKQDMLGKFSIEVDINPDSIDPIPSPSEGEISHRYDSSHSADLFAQPVQISRGIAARTKRDEPASGQSLDVGHSTAAAAADRAELTSLKKAWDGAAELRRLWAEVSSTVRHQFVREILLNEHRPVAGWLTSFQKDA